MNFNQKNWAELLLSAEFAINIIIFKSTQLSLFIINKEYKSQISFNVIKKLKTVR